MCNCIDKINEFLKLLNTEVISAIHIPSGERLGIYLETQKIDKHKRGKAAKILATYCPICGRKYEGEFNNNVTT